MGFIQMITFFPDDDICEIQGVVAVKNNLFISVNSALPIRITTSDIEIYPEFSKLLLVLSNQVSERAVSNEIEEELIKVS
jgi:hypothetical protein